MPMCADGIERSAIFSKDRVYRYTLERYWNCSLGHVLFILLNPSTADARRDDPTNRRGMGYAKDWGFGGVVFVNLFACRTPDPAIMKTERNPIGPDNDRHIFNQVALATFVVLAWGNHGTHLNRSYDIANELLSRDCWGTMWHFGLTKKGQPKHPLYLKRSAPLQLFDGLPAQAKGH